MTGRVHAYFFFFAELSFAFKRARSRIIEMGSEEYLKAHLLANKGLYDDHHEET
jgi:predicted ATPase